MKEHSTTQSFTNFTTSKTLLYFTGITTIILTIAILISNYNIISILNFSEHNLTELGSSQIILGLAALAIITLSVIVLFKTPKLSMQNVKKLNIITIIVSALILFFWVFASSGFMYINHIPYLFIMFYPFNVLLNIIAIVLNYIQVYRHNNKISPSKDYAKTKQLLKISALIMIAGGIIGFFYSIISYTNGPHMPLSSVLHSLIVITGIVTLINFNNINKQNIKKSSLIVTIVAVAVLTLTTLVSSINFSQYTLISLLLSLSIAYIPLLIIAAFRLEKESNNKNYYSQTLSAKSQKISQLNQLLQQNLITQEAYDIALQNILSE